MHFEILACFFVTSQRTSRLKYSDCCQRLDFSQEMRGNLQLAIFTG